MTPIPGSNMPLAAVGVFLLWLGWFGFNGGSVLSADPELTSFTLVTTCLAAAAGDSWPRCSSWHRGFQARPVDGAERHPRRSRRHHRRRRHVMTMGLGSS